MKQICILTACLFLFPLAVAALEKPTPEEAKKFLDFYYHGKGNGVVLADLKICSSIGEDAENMNECAEEIMPDALKKGNAYYVWMVFLVPNGDEVDGIEIRFNRLGETRTIKETSVVGSIRYRTWRRFVPQSEGKWEIVVVHQEETLGTKNLKVIE